MGWINYPEGTRFPPQRSAGPFVMLADGGHVSLSHPDPRALSAGVLARGLNRIARFNGQLAGRGVWTVAQHTLAACHLAKEIANTGDAIAPLAALLHDAHEAVTGDIITPVARALFSAHGIPEPTALDGMKHTLDRAIAEALGIDLGCLALAAPIVRAVDAVLLYEEVLRFNGRDAAAANNFYAGHSLPLHDAARRAIDLVLDETTDPVPAGINVDVWPADAERVWLETLAALVERHKAARRATGLVTLGCVTGFAPQPALAAQTYWP